MPPEKNNAVSGIVNLSRNMGGDIGIAFVTTLIARRSQFHQDTLVGRTSNYDATFTARVDGHQPRASSTPGRPRPTRPTRPWR